MTCLIQRRFFKRENVLINGLIIRCLLCLVFSLCTAVRPVFSRKPQFHGMFSLSAAVNRDPAWGLLLNTKYVPQIFWGMELSKKSSLDIECALNTNILLESRQEETLFCEGELDLYRFWLRWSAPRLEVRAGLQKINFGPAVMLRSLMWFDRIDPRDPLQITDGVTGLLARYYFLNNANVWLWGLYGNEGNKGLEVFPTTKKRPEIGGRFQFPVPRGEVAVTVHTRRFNLVESPAYPGVEPETGIPEKRFAVDGKWDVGIGLWFEGVVNHRRTEVPVPAYKRTLTLGLDYTFGLGNGLNAALEHLMLAESAGLFTSGQGMSFTALSMNYPLGIVDSVSGIFYYDWERHHLYSFMSWRRTTDNLNFYVMFFWNPERFQVFGSSAGGRSFGGKGFLVMMTLHH